MKEKILHADPSYIHSAGIEDQKNRDYGVRKL